MKAANVAGAHRAIRRNRENFPTLPEIFPDHVGAFPIAKG
jgi:hypothetical protein